MTLIFCIAQLYDINCLLNIFQQYGRIAGSKINLDKSSLLISSLMPQNVKESILYAIKMKIMSEGMKYLSMSLFWGRSKVKWLEQLPAKIESRIKNWNSKSLSQAKRTRLINSVSNRMANYAIAIFSF